MSENLICIRFVNQLKELQALNQLAVNHFDFFHIPNGGSRKSSIEGYHFKLLGVKPGVPDYMFSWSDGDTPDFGFIEFKTKKGTLSKSQKEFKEKCRFMNVKNEMARSEEDGINILKQWGVLK